jgi:hypothetical protein
MKTIVLALSLATLACAQPPASQLTLGEPNCRGWLQGFNEVMRTGFVIGFNTAVLASGDRTWMLSTTTTPMSHLGTY